MFSKFEEQNYFKIEHVLILLEKLVKKIERHFVFFDLQI